MLSVGVVGIEEHYDVSVCLFENTVLWCLTSRCLGEPRMRALFAASKNETDVLHHLSLYNICDVAPAIPVPLCSHWYDRRELVQF